MRTLCLTEPCLAKHRRHWRNLSLRQTLKSPWKKNVVSIYHPFYVYSFAH